MSAQQGVTKMRLERIGDERDRTASKLEDLLSNAEDEQRELNSFEQEQAEKYRTQIGDYEQEIISLATDVERNTTATDVSSVLRRDEADRKRHEVATGSVYRSFAQYARDAIVIKYPEVASLASNAMHMRMDDLLGEAKDRVERAVTHTLTSDIPGLLPPQHIAQIMDLINSSRPVVESARHVDLDRGSLTYPQITGRPTVVEQTTQKTEAGTAGMDVALNTMTAKSFLGAGNLSWQAVNWSSPDALQLWFDLAAEAYARETEEYACDVLEDSTAGTVGTASGRLGTAGTESFAQWRAGIIAGISAAYTNTSGRARTNTLYLSANRFFQLAGLGSDQTLQMSAVGNLDIGSMTGTYAGLRVVGSYGFDQDTAIVGDSSAFLVAETPGAPVQMRVVEPSIAGMEVGVIGAFAAVVFDPLRFQFLSTHL